MYVFFLDVISNTIQSLKEKEMHSYLLIDKYYASHRCIPHYQRNQGIQLCFLTANLEHAQNMTTQCTAVSKEIHTSQEWPQWAITIAQIQ